MNLERATILKVLGFACSRFMPFFTLKRLNTSKIWHNQLIKFLLIAAPRTGSNLLVSMLNSHPDILCHFELFHWQEVYSAGGGQGDLSLLWERNRHPVAFLEKTYSNSYGKKAVGFKLFPNQNPSILNYLIHQSGVKKIILKRSNYLYTYTSHLMAKKSKTYTYRPDVLKTPVYVNPKRLIAYIKKNEAFFRKVKNKIQETNQDFFEIEYQQVKDPAWNSNLMKYIGVDSSFILKAATQKQNPESLADRIINFSEVCRALSKTEYAMLLKESYIDL
jgi:LPS sulfotransferase NodH